MFRKSLVAAVISLTFAACSLDYSSVYVSEDMSEELPDSILIAFTHTDVKNGLPVFRLSAAEAYIYNKKKETRLTDVIFQEYDSAGDIITEGKAARALFFTETENAELWGDLYFYSGAEEASFATRYLYWDNVEKKLTGDEDLPVSIRRDSGTEIRGTGFEAEARTRIVTFSGPVGGTYVLEDDKGTKRGE